MGTFFVLCELNQAKLGSVNFRQSCQLNFGIVVRGIKITNLISRTLFVEKIQQIKINFENKQIFKNEIKVVFVYRYVGL